MNLSPYNILDITPGADWEKIKKAYKKQALKWHPDKQTPQGFTKEQQTEKFKEISNAFEQLYKEKLGSDEENIQIFDPQDMLDELFNEAGFDNYESWSRHFLEFIKNSVTDSIKTQMTGIEEEINADPNFWSRFGEDWEERIKQMDDSSKIFPFKDEMLEALKIINEEKLAKERAKIDEFVENSDKGLKFIRKHLKHKNLSNVDFNDYIKKSSPALMTVGNNWYEEHINWGHKNSINTYTSLIDSCANEKQRILDKQRVDWKRKEGGDNYLRAAAIAEINNKWGSEITINGKNLANHIGSDWRSQINKARGSDINKIKDQFNKMINDFKNNTNQNSSSRGYLPYILGGIGIFALLSLIIVLATNKRRR